MKLLILESFNNITPHLICLPNKNLNYTLVDSTLIESKESDREPFITRNQTDFYKRDETGIICSGMDSFMDYLEFSIVKKLEYCCRALNNFRDAKKVTNRAKYNLIFFYMNIN